MRAAWFESFGEPKETMITGDIEKPTPGDGEVLVRIRASGVNPSDTKKRAGAFPNLLDNGYIIPHSDGAGVVEAVGTGVSSDRVGQRVWLYQAQYGRRFGTAAEYIAIDSARAPELPDAASYSVGAVLGIPVMTAHRCIFADGPVDNQTILITGGAGRVGYYAIQWAKRAGATVITTVSNEQDRQLCQSLGADHVVNHREPDWSKQLLAATGGGKVDRVVDVEFGANLSEVLDCIRIGGVIATYSSMVVPEPALPFKRMMFMDLTIRMVLVYEMPEAAKQQAVDDIRTVLDNNEFTHRIAHELALADIDRAHELIEQGGFGGCVVVKV